MKEKLLSPRRRPDPWSRADEEPAISDVMTDPIVRLLMDRDGVSPRDILRVISVIKPSIQRNANALSGLPQKCGVLRTNDAAFTKSLFG